MNRNHFWKFIFTVFVVGWAVYEMYPPSSRPLLDVFRERAVARDEAFNDIIKRMQELQKSRPHQEYANLMEASGTNDLRRYFPFYGGKQELKPNSFVLNRLQKDAAGRIRLGLDLQGGTSFVLSMNTSNLVETSDARLALDNAVEVLRKRVDNLGVAEPVIQPQGADRIVVQLPGLSQAARDEAVRSIQRAAYLTFRLVHPDSERLLQQGIVEPGYEILRRVHRDDQGKETVEAVMVKKKAEMDGSGVVNAMVVRGNLGEPQIDFALNSEGAQRFGQITRANIGQRLAIVLDGELYSAPVIQSAIETGRGQITGKFDDREAVELANVLENPLRTPLKVEYSNDVDPTLGADSIKSGVKATIIGMIAVAGFMMVFYFLGGAIANFALCLNLVITIGAMCLIGSTLTLPGIAGLLLSVAMAVDANVLIFERIREELAAGKSLRGAVSAGYSRAFGTIFDSNLTTLIASVVLIKMGTGPIRGFGVTLTIGVLVSLFTALVVTRLIFDFLLARNLLKRLSMLPVVKITKVDFIGMTKAAAIFSVVMILVGLGYGIGVRGHKVLGVDFAGGDSVTLHFAKKVEVDKVREVVGKLGVGEPTIQYQKPLGGGTETLGVTTALGTSGKVEAALAEAFPEAAFKRVGFDQVGPTVGSEIQRSAVLAALFAIFGILVYVAFRYEFSFAVAAVVATGHDVLLTVGIFFLAGGQLSAPIVAAILTILGYSINDKIVILDRIREDLKLGVRGSFRDLINLALNQTLSRTLITGGSVILATMALFIWGGGVLNDFAFMFLVGILAGTYSSIFIASAIVLGWHKGQRPQIGAPQLNVEGAAPQKA